MTGILRWPTPGRIPRHHHCRLGNLSSPIQYLLLHGLYLLQVVELQKILGSCLQQRPQCVLVLMQVMKCGSVYYVLVLMQVMMFGSVYCVNWCERDPC